ncbi:MAG: hypothetical protein IPI58_09720 [Alphaproteobacteria bacterium]|nr:MAG: hypothetical protein IPI58_09720 [Alphaproteobacteria bacterium]
MTAAFDSLLSALKRLTEDRLFFKQKVEVPPPPMPVQVGDEDDDEEVSGGENFPVPGFFVFIVYVDRNGDETKRRITIRTIQKKSGKTYIRAFCHERNAYRTFIAGNVRSIVDITTGQAIGNMKIFFEEHICTDPSASWSMALCQALRRVGHEISILAYFGKCDGLLDKQEAEVISRYVIATCPDLPLEEDRIKTYARHILPDKDAFVDGCNAIVAAVGDQASNETVIERLGPLVDAATEIINCDGKIDPREKKSLKILSKSLNQVGMKLKLKAT